MPYYYLEIVTCGQEGDLREGRLLDGFKAVKDALSEFQGSRYVITEMVLTTQAK